MKTILTTTAAALALTGAVHAQDFAGARSLVLDDAIATVTLERANDSVLRVEGLGGDQMTLTATRDGNAVRIAGPEPLDEDAFWDAYTGRSGVRIGPVRLGGSGRSVTIRNGRDARFEAMLEDYPDVRVMVPEGVDLRVEGSGLKLSGDVTLGRVEADENRYLFADLGDADSARLRMSGPGRFTMGDVTGLADAELAGSGDVAFGTVGDAVFVLRGSGDIEAADVSGDASATLQGSGDIEMGRVGGAAEIALRGSGDVEAEEVRGELRASLAGSGDIEVECVNSPAYLSIRGSVGIEVADGRASAFEADVTGSGDIAFGGVAVSPKLRTSGSGDIDVARSEGTVDARGDGIRVDGERVGRD